MRAAVYFRAEVKRRNGAQISTLWIVGGLQRNNATATGFSNPA